MTTQQQTQDRHDKTTWTVLLRVPKAVREKARAVSRSRGQLLSAFCAKEFSASVEARYAELMAAESEGEE